VTDVEDIRKLCEVADQGVAGAVIGRALYEGTLDFEAANKLARELGGKDAWDSQNA
jgi:phosphoribosylformimino-5-aminoimidazole carboxamide ribotide isomerase